MFAEELYMKTDTNAAMLTYYTYQGVFKSRSQNIKKYGYFEKDEEELKRILVLRKLGISVNDLKLLDKNAPLTKDLFMSSSEVRIQELQNELVNQQLSYYDFDFQYYFEVLRSYRAIEESDVLNPAYLAWRRYLANSFDMSLFSLIIGIIFAFVLNISIENNRLLELIYTIILVFVELQIEGILLTKWQTTPGKWLFDIKVTNYDGSSLTLKDALDRGLKKFVHGFGCMIFIAPIVCELKAYSNTKKGYIQSWNEDFQYLAKTIKKNVIARFMVLFILLFTLNLPIQVYRYEFSGFKRGNNIESINYNISHHLDSIVDLFEYKTLDDYFGYIISDGGKVNYTTNEMGGFEDLDIYLKGTWRVFDTLPVNLIKLVILTDDHISVSEAIRFYKFQWEFDVDTYCEFETNQVYIQYIPNSLKGNNLKVVYK